MALTTGAAPVHESTPGTDPVKQNIMDLGWSPGSVISPKSCLTNYDAHICPVPLTNGNIVVTGRHQVLYSSPALADRPNSVRPATNNTFIAGYTVIGDEIRTVSLFPGFPKGPQDTRCRFHFITDGLSYIQSPQVIAAWDVYKVLPGFASWQHLYNKTTWNSAPRLLPGAPIASFVTPNIKEKYDGTAPAGEAVTYDDSGKISMPFIKGGDDFSCPTANEDVAYLVVPRALLVETIKKPQIGDEPFTMSITSQNGLAIEILHTGTRSGYERGANP